MASSEPGARLTAGEPSNLHASAVVLGEAGVLVVGPSGTGKTRLVLALAAQARRDGCFARLVADDRTLVSVHGRRLVARPHPALAGLVERRGFGILAVAHEPACVLRLIVDLLPRGWPPRLPEPGDSAVIAGVALPRLPVASAAPTADVAALVLSALASLAARP